MTRQSLPQHPQINLDGRRVGLLVLLVFLIIRYGVLQSRNILVHVKIKELLPLFETLQVRLAGLQGTLNVRSDLRNECADPRLAFFPFLDSIEIFFLYTSNRSNQSGLRPEQPLHDVVLGLPDIATFLDSFREGLDDALDRFDEGRFVVKGPPLDGFHFRDGALLALVRCLLPFFYLPVGFIYRSSVQYSFLRRTNNGHPEQRLESRRISFLARRILALNISDAVHRNSPFTL
mmetsp:Transcript_7682/g.20387  ORF Transcript_7682/g.20387 Transcript_7682/m.20387 type:complete len:233 (-) Transcript_7682:683-1381(-)